MWFVALYALNQAWILAGCREGQTLSQLHMTRRAPRVGTPAAKLKEPEPEAQEQTAEKDLPAVPDTTAAEYRRMLGKHMRTLPSLAVSSVNPEQRGRRNLHMNLLKRQMARGVILHGMDEIGKAVTQDSSIDSRASLALADFHGVREEFASQAPIAPGSPSWKRLCRVVSFLKRNSKT